MIFGILGKFRIDIGENYFQKNIFFEIKKNREKNQKYFQIFSEKVSIFWEIFPKFPNFFSKIENFRNFWNIFKNFHWKAEQPKYFLFFSRKSFDLEKIF